MKKLLRSLQKEHSLLLFILKKYLTLLLNLLRNHQRIIKTESIFIEIKIEVNENP